MNITDKEYRKRIINAYKNLITSVSLITMYDCRKDTLVHIIVNYKIYEHENSKPNYFSFTMFFLCSTTSLVIHVNWNIYIIVVQFQKWTFFEKKPPNKRRFVDKGRKRIWTPYWEGLNLFCLENKFTLKCQSIHVDYPCVQL